jgi:hypothetical protein
MEIFRRRNRQSLFMDLDSEICWQRLRSEPAKSFRVFEYYRDLGPEKRILSAVAEHFNYTPQTIERWAACWYWRLRAEAFDLQSERAANAKRIRRESQEREEMERLHALLASIMHQKLQAKLVGRKGDPARGITQVTPMDAAEIRVSDLPRWARVIVEIERTARQPVSEIGTDNPCNPSEPRQQMDLSKLSHDEQQQMAELLMKMQSKDET